MGALFGVWTWLAFAVISIIGFCVSLVAFLLTFPFDPNRYVTGRCIRVVGRLMCAATPVWKLSYQGPVPSRLPERCVCVSNHCSNIDPFLLIHLPWEMKFLAKASLFRIPFIGWGMKIAGDISLVRGSSRSVRTALLQAGQYIDRGMPVLFFPEGTRSRDGELLPFKDGAFRLAIEKGAHVLPIAIAGTSTALKKGDWKPSRAHGICIVGEPISTVGLGNEPLVRLKAESRAAIEELKRRLAAQGY
jgi:1-acyl-sn-glycerol-3-phosphate acyltransferase